MGKSEVYEVIGFLSSGKYQQKLLLHQKLEETVKTYRGTSRRFRKDEIGVLKGYIMGGYSMFVLSESEVKDAEKTIFNQIKQDKKELLEQTKQELKSLEEII